LETANQIRLMDNTKSKLNCFLSSNCNCLAMFLILI